MATYLLAATPVHGHVGPVIRVGEHLVERGHRVVMLTGSRFADEVTARGIEFEPLAGRADFDDRDHDSYLPDREAYRGIRRAQYEIRTIFVETIPEQARSVRRLVDRLDPDALLVDGAFAGVLPLIMDGSSAGRQRPPVVGLGVTPLSQSGRGLAPYGLGLPPAQSPLRRSTYSLLNQVVRQVIFRPTQQAATRAVRETGGTLRGFVMDSSREFDRFLQTGPEGLEYPRSELAPNTTFVGVLPQQSGDAPYPDWWPDLDGSRPVVHVTQGTIDNTDFSRLIRPTLEGLRNVGCLVIVTGGGRDVSTIGPLPHNGRAANYLSYAELLPRASCMITNGGYGGVQAAIAYGVPLIVAGDTEEKPEVAARVAWSSAGIDLRTGTPTAGAIRDAVDSILSQPQYRAAAQRLAAQAATHDTLAEIENELEGVRARY